MVTRSRRWPAYMRALVFDRDGGVCAHCGLDTEALKREVYALPPEERAARRRALGWPVHRIDFWDADHVTAVSEDGECSLENLRTLCIPCHKQVSAVLMGRVNAARQPGPRIDARDAGRQDMPEADGAWWIAAKAIRDECPNCGEQLNDVPAIKAYRPEHDPRGMYGRKFQGWIERGWLWWHECRACGIHTPWLGVTADRVRSWRAGPWSPM